MKLTFYTTAQTRNHKGWLVRYLDPEKHELHTFVGGDKPFDDPAEACNEFEACVGGPGSHYLEPPMFKGKVTAFNRQRKRLAEWNASAQPSISSL